jgi:hypothetical protein
MRRKVSGDWEPTGCVSPPELSEPIPLDNYKHYLDGKKTLFKERQKWLIKIQTLTLQTSILTT